MTSLKERLTKRKNEKKILTVDDILDAIRICEGIEEESLRSPNRYRDLVEARQIGMYLVRKDLGMTTHYTGRLFDRDHASVSHATKQVEALYLSNREFREKFDRIEHFAYSEAGNDSLMKLFIELLDKAHVSEHERVRYVNRFLELKIE